MAFNWVDYIILGIFLFSVLIGLSRGVIREVISLLTWLAAFVIASLFAGNLAAVFSGSSKVQSIVTTSNAVGVNSAHPVSWLALGFSFVLIFVGVLIIGSIFNYFLSSAVERGGISFANRLLGAVFGLGRGFLLNLTIIFVMQLIPQVTSAIWWKQSALIPMFQPTIDWLTSSIAPGLESLKSQVGNSLQGVNSQFQDVISNVKMPTTQ